MRPLFALLAAVVLVPLASAGSADDPEIADRAGDARVPSGCSDLLAAWVEANPEGALTFTVEVAECRDPPTTTTEWWGLVFRVPAGRFYAHAVWDAEAREYAFWSGKLKPERLEAESHVRARAEYVAGAPARITLPLPREVANLSLGGELVFEHAQAGVWQGWDPRLPTIWDEARPARGFAWWPAPPPAEAPEPAAASGEEASGTEPRAPPPERAVPGPAAAFAILLGAAARAGFIKRMTMRRA